jgi:hypothetical protein
MMDYLRYGNDHDYFKAIFKSVLWETEETANQPIIKVKIKSRAYS